MVLVLAETIYTIDQEMSKHKKATQATELNVVLNWRKIFLYIF